MVTATAVTSCFYLRGKAPLSLVVMTNDLEVLVMTNDLEVLVICSSLTGINLYYACKPQLTKSGCKNIPATRQCSPQSIFGHEGLFPTVTIMYFSYCS